MLETQLPTLWSVGVGGNDAGRQHLSGTRGWTTAERLRANQHDPITRLYGEDHRYSEHSPYSSRADGAAPQSR